MEDDALVVGAPPAGAQAWVVSHPWLAKQHADPTGYQLLQLTAKLDALQAADEDVVFFDYWSMPQRDVRGVDDRTAEEAKAFDDTMKVLNALYSSEFASVVIIAEIGETAELFEPKVFDANGTLVAVETNTTEYARRGWCFFELLTCLAFQTVAFIDDFIEAQMALMFRGLFEQTSFTSDTSETVEHLLLQRVKQLIEGGDEQENAELEMLSEMARDGTFKLLRVGYIRELAKTSRTVSRRQDLPVKAFANPAALQELRAQQVFAISHPWFTAAHPDPEGVKMKDLAAKFDRLRVSDDALVMIDFASLPQIPRTDEDMAIFRRALNVISIWYSHPHVQVIVTHKGLPDTARGYFDRGWCLFEITCAVFAGSVLFDEVELIEFFLERFFLPQLRTKHFTNGKADEEVVCRKFRELIYLRAGM